MYSAKITLAWSWRFLNSVEDRKNAVQEQVCDSSADIAAVSPQQVQTTGSSAGPGIKLYRIGTLKYTLAGLVSLFCWLLWGDFCFALFESIFGRFMPLYLKDLQASNTVIALLTGSIAGVINILFLPHISMWSDHYRSPRGRRTPFLFWSAPCTVLSLVLIGFAPEIAAYLQSIFGPLRLMSSITLTLTLLGIFTVAWHFFNMVLLNVFRFLLKDVVPQEVMPRFLAYFQITGTVASFTFNLYLFPHVLAERKLICCGVGGLYLVVFLVMCWRVKEGQYPAPPKVQKEPFLVGYVKLFKVYFGECLSIPIYRNLIISSSLLSVAGGCAGPFALLFVSNVLGIPKDDMGKVFAWTSVATAIVMIPMGYLCARINALRLVGLSLACLALATLLAFCFVHDKASWTVYAMLLVIPSAGIALGMSTVQMTVFPAEKFGQFFSSTNTIGCGCVIIGNYIVGRYMDFVNSNYRMIYLVILICYVMALLPLSLVYRDWKRFGGPHHYKAPL